MYPPSLFNSAMSPLSVNWFFGVGGFLLAIILIWSLVWKALALWKAARKGSKIWFVVLLVVNTVGILEILYIYVFSRKGDAME